MVVARGEGEEQWGDGGQRVQKFSYVGMECTAWRI